MANVKPLLLIYHVTSLVSAFLQPPTNLTLISENFQHILTWDEPNNESGIYYKVAYQQDSNPVVNSKSCSNITSRRCDLTKDFTDVMSTYSAMVHSATDWQVSDVVTTNLFNPLSHTSLGPPLVDVVPCDHCIVVFVHPPVSHLWDETEQHNVTMRSDEVYPLLEYTIHYGHSAEPQHFTQMDDVMNATVISKLLPNTNYCMTVEVKSSLNAVPAIPSAQKCVMTGPNEVSQVGRMYVILPVVGGFLLFLGILLCLIALDRAGYISMSRKFLPKVLRSLPQSESAYSTRNECTSPVYIVPEEIVSQKLEVEERLEKEQQYKEGGYASRKKLLDSDTSGGDSSCPILSTNSSSLQSSGQMTGSSGEDIISREHPVGLEIIPDLADGLPPIPAAASESSSDLMFNNNGVFNINLESICIRDSVDTRTGLKNGGSSKEEPEGEPDTNSEQAGALLNEDVIGCPSSVLVDLKPTTIEYNSDNYEEDLSENGDNCDSDDHFLSGYMRR